MCVVVGYIVVNCYCLRLNRGVVVLLWLVILLTLTV